MKSMPALVMDEQLKENKILYPCMQDCIGTMNNLKGIKFTFIDTNNESTVPIKSSNALS
jgi:hypothetical protein